MGEVGNGAGFRSSFARRSCGVNEKSMIENARFVVDEQAEDEGLWFVAETITEAYLQSALRRLHAAVENVPQQPSAPAEKVNVR